MKFLFMCLFIFSSLFAFEELNSQNIDQKLQNKKAIVYFYATWCPRCKVLSKNLKEFDEIKPKDIVIYRVDIDEHMPLSRRYSVRSVPTLVYFKDNKVIAKQIGIQDIDFLQKSTKRYLY